MGNLSQNQNSEAQRNNDCDSCGKSSTQLENLNKHIIGNSFMLDKEITNIFHVENISLNQQV